MKTQNIILVAIAILVVALVGVAAYSYMHDAEPAANATQASNNTTKFINIGTINANDTNKTYVVGDNSPRNNTTNLTNNTTYKVYNPQTDSYVTVIGEKYDKDVNRWYTYDTDGVRYYNTRIK